MVHIHIHVYERRSRPTLRTSISGCIISSGGEGGGRAYAFIIERRRRRAIQAFDASFTASSLTATDRADGDGCVCAWDGVVGTRHVLQKPLESDTRAQHYQLVVRKHMHPPASTIR